MKQLAVDLVILNEHPPSYAQDLRTALEAMVRATESRLIARGQRRTRGAVFILRAELVSDEARGSAPKRRTRGAFQPPRKSFRTSEDAWRSSELAARDIAKTRRAEEECRTRFRAAANSNSSMASAAFRTTGASM